MIFRAIGYHVHGSEYHDRIEESVRCVVEKCDRLHGFLLMHSLGGGTGSGLGTATLKLLRDNYPHVERYFLINIYEYWLNWKVLSN